MRTISVAELKAHLSAELKRVTAGDAVTVLDHKKPVACLNPLPEELEYLRPKRAAYAFKPLEPLMAGDPLTLLDEERGDR
jgi:antitoxin (DNA-binding transcriptional repressor) of toxin-antitoxin stability system